MPSKNIALILIVAIISFGLGGFAGFTVGSGLNEVFSDLYESQPDLKNPKTAENKFFKIKYPGNWKIELDEINDYFSSLYLNTSGMSTIYLSLEDSEGTDELWLEELVDTYSLPENIEKTTKFSSFGKIIGKGKTIISKEELGSKDIVKVFCAKVGGRKFCVVMQYSNDDYSIIEKGIKLVESSLELFPDSSPDLNNTKTDTND